MDGMPGLQEWHENYAAKYDPEQLILELGNPLPEMVIMDVLLKDCYWFVNPKAEDEQERKEVSKEVSF